MNERKWNWSDADPTGHTRAAEIELLVAALTVALDPDVDWHPGLG